MKLNIAVLGTRGIPANYGGFETFAEELSVRLVKRRHRVTVYGRSHYVSPGTQEFQGVKIVRLPAIRSKHLDTVSHTAASVLHTLVAPHDVLLICNAANAFLSWIPRLRFQKVVLNVDGIERKRRKWGPAGKLFYRLGEHFSGWFPHAVVTDAQTIQEYYRNKHRLETVFIPYGSPARSLASRGTLDRLGLEPGKYLLYVSRLEPENNADLVLRAYLEADIQTPLVLVGDAPYSDSYISQLRRMASQGNVLMPGSIYGKGYWELLSHCLLYFHATEIGGTHPALLEAMGAGSLVIVNDTPENREVMESCGLLHDFRDMEGLSVLIREVVDQSQEYASLRKAAQQRIRQQYNWEKVTDQYERLFHELVD